MPEHEIKNFIISQLGLCVLIVFLKHLATPLSVKELSLRVESLKACR